MFRRKVGDHPHVPMYEAMAVLNDALRRHFNEGVGTFCLERLGEKALKMRPARHGIINRIFFVLFRDLHAKRRKERAPLARRLKNGVDKFQCCCFSLSTGNPDHENVFTWFLMDPRSRPCPQKVISALYAGDVIEKLNEAGILHCFRYFLLRSASAPRGPASVPLLFVFTFAAAAPASSPPRTTPASATQRSA